MGKKLFACVIITFFLVFLSAILISEILSQPAPKLPPKSDEIRAIYLSTNNIFNKRKIEELENIIRTTNANGIVIDFKDSNSLPQDYMATLAKRFKNCGAYTIARIVTFQDSYFTRKHPEIAIKNSTGEFWYSGRKIWQRYWLDPASELVQDYNIEVAKRAIDAGFDEIQFDYIRFPTDGNMKDICYPVFNTNKTTRTEVMKIFLQKIRDSLKSYSPKTLIGIDVFGEVFVYGNEAGIGQKLLDIAEYFDVISPMAYPSHYMCRGFGFQDPTAHPYEVYFETLRRGLNFLGKKKVIVRPWVQDFTIRSIYGCGPTVVYDKEKVLAQIQASRDLGINGFMLWNVSNNFTTEVFE